MSEQLAQFASDLHQEIIARVGADGENGDRGGAAALLREEMFASSVLELLDDHDEVDNWDICGFEQRSIGAVPAAKLNAWSLSGDGATLDLFVCLYHGTGEVVEVGKPEMRRQFALLLGFLKRGLSGFHARMEEASDAFHAAQQIYEARQSLATVRLFLLTDGLLRSLEIEQEMVPGVDVRYVAWDIQKLANLRVGERAVIELDFTRDDGGGLPCLEVTDGTTEYRTFLSFMPAPLIAKIYGEFGQRLLERNVRAFLQSKGKINKGLQATLRDEPHRFLAYNNGLCCTAAEVDVTGPGTGPDQLLRARDFQIVNGGQTTASIFHAMKKERVDVSHVSVQMKLTVLSDPARVAEIVPLISRYANSQNKVNGADFSANGRFHTDLELQSRTVWAPAAGGMERGTRWYYERARGSYMDDKNRQGTPARQREWARQHPAHQKFTKTDLAKFEHVWLGLPHFVCRGAEKNFGEFAKRLEEDGEPTVSQEFFQNVVARAVLWRSAEQLFDSLDLAGYRANSVAFAVAWIAERSGRRLDLDRIWRDQKIPEALAHAIGTATAASHRYLSGLPGNVGEASKKPEAWAAFRDMDLPVGSLWNASLVAEAAIHYPAGRPKPEVAEAKRVVAEVPAERWFALSKWSKERSLLKGWERALVFSLGKLAAAGKPPSDKQAIQGARIIERARELGF